MEQWEGKVAIVTGASSGIGAAICRALVEKGLKVIGLARRVERIEELACSITDKPGELFAVACDLTKEEDILEAFKWVTENVGPVHVLINNAGLTKPASLTDGPTEIWRQVLDVNVLALCICTREAIKIMKENDINGQIINLNSIVGHKVPAMANVNLYPASKFAVTALTESLRHELNAEGCKIKVTSLSPGLVHTEFQDGLADDVKEVVKQMVGLVPEDIAEAVIYILSTGPRVQVSELTVRPVGEIF